MTTTTNDEARLERHLRDAYEAANEIQRAAALSKNARHMTLVERLRRAQWALRRAHRHAVSAVRR